MEEIPVNDEVEAVKSEVTERNPIAARKLPSKMKWTLLSKN